MIKEANVVQLSLEVIVGGIGRICPSIANNPVTTSLDKAESQVVATICGIAGKLHTQSIFLRRIIWPQIKVPLAGLLAVHIHLANLACLIVCNNYVCPLVFEVHSDSVW